jgi:hypothetical protein
MTLVCDNSDSGGQQAQERHRCVFKERGMAENVIHGLLLQMWRAPQNI